MKNIFFSLLILFTACTASAMTLTEQDAGQTINATLNQPISIVLKANATTGYTWHFSSDNTDSYTVLQDEYQVNKHPQGMVGVGGQSIYQINPIKSGTFTIDARYYRSWENFNPQTDKAYQFIFEVE